jgi:hypothetical protein
MLPACFDEAVREVVWRHVGPFWLAHWAGHGDVRDWKKPRVAAFEDRRSRVRIDAARAMTPWQAMAAPVNVPDRGARQGADYRRKR